MEFGDRDVSVFEIAIGALTCQPRIPLPEHTNLTAYVVASLSNTVAIGRQCSADSVPFGRCSLDDVNIH